jgi:hypothetical protein
MAATTQGEPVSTGQLAMADQIPSGSNWKGYKIVPLQADIAD